MQVSVVAVMGPVQFQARNRLQDRPMKLKNLQKVARPPADFYDFKLFVCFLIPDR